MRDGRFYVDKEFVARFLIFLVMVSGIAFFTYDPPVTTPTRTRPKDKPSPDDAWKIDIWDREEFKEEPSSEGGKKVGKTKVTKISAWDFTSVDNNGILPHMPSRTSGTARIFPERIVSLPKLAKKFITASSSFVYKDLPLFTVPYRASSNTNSSLLVLPWWHKLVSTRANSQALDPSTMFLSTEAQLVANQMRSIAKDQRGLVATLDVSMRSVFLASYALSEGYSVVSLFALYEDAVLLNLGIELNGWRKRGTVIHGMASDQIGRIEVAKPIMTSSRMERQVSVLLSSAGDGSLAEDEVEWTRVPMFRADSSVEWVSMQEPISVLYVNLKGYELKGLKGALYLFKTGRIKSVIHHLSSKDMKQAGDNPQELFDFMHEMGFLLKGFEDADESVYKAEITHLVNSRSSVTCIWLKK